MHPFADRAVITQVAEPDPVETHADSGPSGGIPEALQPLLEWLPASVGNVIIDFVRICLHCIVIYKLHSVKRCCIALLYSKFRTEKPPVCTSQIGGSHSTDIPQGRSAHCP